MTIPQNLFWVDSQLPIAKYIHSGVFKVQLQRNIFKVRLDL